MLDTGSSDIKIQSILEKLQSLYDDAPCGYHCLDADGKVVRVNNTELKMLGYSREEILGRNFTEFLTEEASNIFNVNFPNIQKWENPQDVEVEMIRKDGSILLAKVHSKVIKDELDNCLITHSIVVDISDRLAQQELALQEAEQFRLALELTETGMWDWDLRTGMIHWNDSHYMVLGYQPREVEATYQAWRDRVHPDDLAVVEQKLLLAQATHTNYEAEFRVIYPDSSIHWALGKGQTIDDEAGQPVRMIGTIVDITPRKQTEIALREQEAKISLFVKYAPVSVAMFDQQMRYLTVSQRWLEMYRIGSEDTIIGHSHYEIFPNISDDWKQIHQQCLDGATKKCDQDYFILSDGSEQWLKWEVQPWQFDHGEVGGILIFVEDITLSKQAEINLHQTQENLTIAIEAAQMGTWYLDLVNDVSSVRSLRHDQIFGYETAQTEWGEAIARKHVLEEDQKIWEQAFARAIKTGVLDFEVRIRWSDGSIHWMTACGRFYFDDKGNPLNAAGVNLDITERKQAEIALKEQMEKERLVTNIAQNIRQTLDLHQILQTTVDQVRELLKGDRVMIFRFDPDGNGAVIAESITGDWPSLLDQIFHDDCCIDHYFNFSQADFYSRTDIGDLELCFYEFFAPCQVKASLTVPITHAKQLWGYLIVHQCSRTRQWQPTEIQLLQQLAIQVSIAIKQSELYEQTRQELLERQKTEQKIIEQAALIDLATDAIFVHDLDDTILFWSKGAERLYGWTEAEVLGKKTQSLFNQDLEQVLSQAIQQAIAEGSWMGELEQITKDHKKIIVESRKTLIKNQFSLSESVLVVNTNITEKKQIEKQFYQAQRLESLGTLASGIAHDLNNILTPMLGVAQLLPLKLKNLDQRTKDLVDILEANARRGADLVRQILTFARGMDGTPIVIEPQHLIKEVGKIARQTLPKSIEISMDIDTHNLFLLKVEPTKLHQILMNLVVNARDAMPQGGQLTIAAQNQFVDALYVGMNTTSAPDNYREGNYVLITVTDTGMGISREVVQHIFDPFFTTKEMGKGTGLGLSTVIGIIHSYNGFIEVNSELGRGTSFKVYLPAVEEQVEGEIMSPKSSSGNGELILIVDDEPFIQQITKISLEDANYRTLLASNGVEAIALYVEHTSEIYAIVMDIMMPVMNGLTAILTLKSINPNVRIIATGGLAENQQAALEAGADAFMVKPYVLQDLLGLLASVQE